MRGELARLQKETGIIFVHVTHGQDEALALADRVVLMNAARIEQSGTPHEVFERPATEFVARFMGGHNVVEIERRPHAVRTDRVRIAEAGTATGAARPATVARVEYLGRQVELALEGQGSEQANGQGTDELTASLDAGEYAARPWRTGERVEISWNPEDLHPLAPSPNLAAVQNPAD